MKIKDSLILLFCLICFTKANPSIQCLISANLFPLRYFDRTSTMELRVHLESNCKPYYLPLYFELPWEVFEDLTVGAHPRNVSIYFFEKNYELHYSNPVHITLEDKLAIDYHTVTLIPSNYEDQELDATQLNENILETRDGGVIFSKEQVDSLWQIDHPVLCSIQNGKTQMVCEIA